jgi:hypothetical protein
LTSICRSSMARERKPSFGFTRRSRSPRKVSCSLFRKYSSERGLSGHLREATLTVWACSEPSRDSSHTIVHHPLPTRSRFRQPWNNT